jgi:hypothetical protein
LATAAVPALAAQLSGIAIEKTMIILAGALNAIPVSAY